MHKVKYLTKGLLIAVAGEGERRNFNRQIDPNVLDDVTDERMPVEFCMTHNHAGGVRVASHARCFVTLQTKGETLPSTCYIDMTFERYDSLPIIEVAAERLVEQS